MSTELFIVPHLLMPCVRSEPHLRRQKLFIQGTLCLKCRVGVSGDRLLPQDLSCLTFIIHELHEQLYEICNYCILQKSTNICQRHHKNGRRGTEYLGDTCPYPPEVDTRDRVPLRDCGTEAMAKRRRMLAAAAAAAALASAAD